MPRWSTRISTGEHRPPGGRADVPAVCGGPSSRRTTAVSRATGRRRQLESRSSGATSCPTRSRGRHLAAAFDQWFDRIRAGMIVMIDNGTLSDDDEDPIAER